jgi:hypothetical protein
MEIKIKKIDSRPFPGTASGVINTYTVVEDGREFVLTRTSHPHGSSLGFAGEKGILYVDRDDNRVHRQVIAPSGACGLNTDDEMVEGLSPLSLRGVLMVDQCNESGEIKMIA